MMTWSVTKDKGYYLVTAEDVETARNILLRQHGILVLNAELVPVVTSTRWTRKLK
jgi:hypothetical protein